jgi:hypothetical protein
MVYLYNMTLYLVRGRKCAAVTVISAHAIMTELIAWIEHVGHKLFIDNFISSPDLHDDTLTKTINCCCTVGLNRIGMPRGFGKKLQMKRG